MTISVEQTVGIDQVRLWKRHISTLANKKGIALSDRQVRKYLQECIKTLLQKHSNAARWAELLGNEYIN